MTDFSDFLDLLKMLIHEPSVVGAEHSFLRTLQRELEARGARVTWYQGVLVAHGDEPHETIFSAHVDRHGLICTGPNEFQYAAFIAGRRSDLLGNSVSERLMSKITDRFRGVKVLAYEPWSGGYMGRGTIHSATVCEHRNNLIFEVSGLDHLIAGTPAALDQPLRSDGNYISAQLDNVLTTAALVHLFSLGYEGTAFFTCEEESGSSWRYLLEWFRRFGSSTDELIVVDTSPFPDREAADAQDIVLRKRDANSPFNAATTAKIEQTCQDLGVRYSYKDEYVEALNTKAVAAGGEPQSLGSTEMGRIAVASNGGVQGTTLQIPTTGYHTVDETAALTSCEAFLKVLGGIAGLA